jgi:hypothetical protein
MYKAEVKKFLKSSQGIICLIICALLIGVNIFIIKPKLYGDGSEYYLMLEGFYNHQSPDQRTEDVNSLFKISTQSDSINPPFRLEAAGSGYYEAKNGAEFSYHFWLYPLISLPAKNFLKLINSDQMKAFQLTNAILFSFLILLVGFIFKRSKYFYLILGIIILTPAIWYTHWTHPEVFSFVLVMGSLLLFTKKKFNISILFSALASTQNPPIIFFTGFISLLALYDSKFTQKDSEVINFTVKKFMKKFALIILAALPTLLPYLFYYFYFGVFNLIVSEGHSDFKLVSIKRVLELFFDPNVGILFYSPVITIVGIFTFFYSIFHILKFKKSGKLNSFVIIGLFLVLTAEFAFSSSTLNWNSGTTGPMRYVLWSAIPIFLAIIFLGFKTFWQNLSSKFILFGLAGTLLVGSAIVLTGGFLEPVNRLGSSAHSVPARIILTVVPQFYNPTPMIFEGRSKKINDDIYIYKTSENSSCKKALVNNLEQNSEQICLLCGDYRVDTCYDLKCYLSL